MQLEDFITWVYCFVDDEVKNLTKTYQLRTRGYSPALSDAEVITMELIGELQGFDTDKGIYEYIKNHWLTLFPALGSRSQFAKQANNLWAVKQFIRDRLTSKNKQSKIFVIDGFPIPICHYARSSRCKKFKEVANFGYCSSKKEKYYGFKGHLLINSSGSICGFNIAAANLDERALVPELSEAITGLILADKGYISEKLKEELKAQHIVLEASLRKNMPEHLSEKERAKCMKIRRKVETVISQLSQRLNGQIVKCKSMLGLTNRLNRKVLAHLVVTSKNKIDGISTLNFARLFS